MTICNGHEPTLTWPLPQAAARRRRIEPGCLPFIPAGGGPIIACSPDFEDHSPDCAALNPGYGFIKALLRANRTTLDMKQVREYFCLFEGESLLDEILRETV